MPAKVPSKKKDPTLAEFDPAKAAKNPTGAIQKFAPVLVGTAGTLGGTAKIMGFDKKLLAVIGTRAPISSRPNKGKRNKTGGSAYDYETLKSFGLILSFILILYLTNRIMKLRKDKKHQVPQVAKGKQSAKAVKDKQVANDKAPCNIKRYIYILILVTALFITLCIS
jgi:hypothetical protein